MLFIQKYLGIIIPLIAFLYWMMHIRKESRENLLLGFFLLASVSIEITAHYLFYQRHSTFPIYNFYYILEVLFYCIIYSTNPFLKKYARIIIFLSVVFILYHLYSIYISKYYILFFNNYYGIYILSLVLLSILLFKEIYFNNNVIEANLEPIFWVSIAILSYFPCSYLILKISSMQTVDKDNDYKQLFFILNTIPSILYYVFLSIAVKCTIPKN